jgi:cyclophilin family peptidyl-prolyl cis-trans isomerase
MKTLLSILALCLSFAVFQAQADNPKVRLDTDLGVITIELYPQQAPITVENFLGYVRSGFYNGTLFHRVIPNFMAQAGGYTFDFNKKETKANIKNESSNGLKNLKGTLAMARTSNPDSASAQFFINLVDNPHLDYKENEPGYAVFAKVIDGMDVVDDIVKEPRGVYRNFPDSPNNIVRILKAVEIK